MAIRNIDKGYISTGIPDTSTYISMPMKFAGAADYVDVSATFNKVGRIICMTLPSVMSQIVSTGAYFESSLPAGYESDIMTSQFVYVSSYDLSGTTWALYPGYIQLNGSIIRIYTTGQFTSGTTNQQGIPVSVSIVYISAS